MILNPWPAGTATGIGSMPGSDPLEAAKTIVGELPDLPHLPELPARGVGADMIGRTAAMLVDLAVEEVTSGYRVTSRPGRDHNRAVGLLRTDLDAFDEALERVASRPGAVKVQATGPWTLAANVELRNGHRVLTDSGAVREFTASLAEGVALHAAEVAKRTGARVVVQLDEPSLPAALAGSLPTPSGLGTVDAVSEADAQAALRTVLESITAPRIVHCCAADPPVGLLRAAGADIVAVDLAQLGDSRSVDAIGEAWDEGATLLLGVVPSAQAQAMPPALREIVKPVFALADQLGFARHRLAELVVPTPACGLGGATPGWARRALALVRDAGRALVEPPEGW